MPSGSAGAPARGFVYIALLIGLAVIGVGLSATSAVWTQTRQREKEAELLFVGNQIRQAITRFYLQSPPAARRFPLTLDELVEDLRTPDKPRRFLRMRYPDPMTRLPQWGEVRLASGQLVGVYSLSQDAPFKVYGFAARDKDMLDKMRYSEWVFRSALPAANPVLAAGAGYAPPGSTPATPATPFNPASPFTPNAPGTQPRVPTRPGAARPTLPTL